MAQKKYQNNTKRYVDKPTVWRTYYGERISILEGTQKIHKTMFSQKKNVYKYGKGDAELLTKFFQDYKTLSQGKSISSFLITEMFGNSITLPVLNFSQSGIRFEKELQTLLDKNFDRALTEASSTLGGQSAYVRLDLGKNSKGLNQEDFLKKVLGDNVGMIIDKTTEKISNDIMIENDNGVEHYYLKVGRARSGKIDNAGQGEINLTYTGTATPQLQHILNILSNATFSVKSYATNTSIHLGKTQSAKAVSGIASYVGGKGPQGAALYYLKYPNPSPTKEENIAEIQEIYSHYTHMKKIYELAGFGLTYANIKDALSVDFLLVNRAKGAAIKVYSVKELIQSFEQNEKYNIDI